MIFVLFLRGDPTRDRIFLCPHFLAKSFRAIGIGQGILHTLVSGLHVGLHNSAIPAGYVPNSTEVVFSKILL